MHASKQLLDAYKRAAVSTKLIVEHISAVEDGIPPNAPMATQLAIVKWPVGSGVMRRPLVPLPNRPNPTDPGDAADLSTP
jgi:hypothetical protein